MTDPNFQALRVKMVDGQLRTSDVTSYEILDAFLSTPRENFVAENHRALAYSDHDIQLAPSRFMMGPAPLAKLLQLAAIKPQDKVLIVGAGSGYSTAIVATMASHVVALEDEESLSEQTAANLAMLGVKNTECVKSPLQSGAPSKAPFDVILVEGAVADAPEMLMQQLATGGRLVVVEGTGLSGVSKCYVKSASSTSAVRGFNVSVKPLPGFASTPQFSF